MKTDVIELLRRLNMFISTRQEFELIKISIGDKWRKTAEKQDGVICKES